MGSITEDTASLPVRSNDGIKFGKELREKDFMFEKGYLNLNHGMSPALLLLLNPTKYHFHRSLLSLAIAGLDVYNSPYMFRNSAAIS
jgi:hypothetical protein